MANHLKDLKEGSDPAGVLNPKVDLGQAKEEVIAAAADIEAGIAEPKIEMKV